VRGVAKSDYDLLQDEMRQLKRKNASLRKLLKLLSESDQHPTVTVAEVAGYARQGLAAIGEEAQP